MAETKKTAPKKTNSTGGAAKKPAAKKPAAKASVKKSTPSQKSSTTSAKAPAKSSTTTTQKPSSSSSSTKAPAKKPASSTASAKTPAKTSTTNGTKSGANNNNNNNNSTRDPNAPPPLTPQEQKIQDLLGEGTCHLPGNGWWQDWWMHLTNGHPLFSVCCQHPLNPVSRSMRAVQLLASVAMGLIITNILYLAFIHDDKQDQLVSDLTKKNATNIRWGGLTEEEKAQIEKYTTVQLSAGMAFLWTVGSAVHAMFDSSMFYITTCACCNWENASPRVLKIKKMCNVFVVIGVIVVTAVASMSIILRANVEGGGDMKITTLSSDGTSIQRETVSNKSNYEFMLSYALELAFSWFVWFPLVDVILFSGVLARWKCCRKCVGGGRPAALEEQGDVEQGNRPSKKK